MQKKLFNAKGAGILPSDIVWNSIKPLDVRKTGRINSLRKIEPRERKNGIEVLTKFLKGSREAIIIDPYFYAGNTHQSVEEYINELKDVFSNFHSIKKIHIIYNEDHCNKGIHKDIRKAFLNIKECEITDIHTDEIHDRIWIKDREYGRLVGHSFNGLGRKKICFIVSLPRQDLIDLKFFLQRKKLVPDGFLVIED